MARPRPFRGFSQLTVDLEGFEKSIVGLCIRPPFEQRVAERTVRCGVVREPVDKGLRKGHRPIDHSIGPRICIEFEKIRNAFPAIEVGVGSRVAAFTRKMTEIVPVDQGVSPFPEVGQGGIYIGFQGSFECCEEIGRLRDRFTRQRDRGLGHGSRRCAGDRQQSHPCREDCGRDPLNVPRSQTSYLKIILISSADTE